jgi:hypothetical protein
MVKNESEVEVGEKRDVCSLNREREEGEEEE